MVSVVPSGRDGCVIGAGLLKRAWQALQSKVKPWTIFLLLAWKSITQNRRWMHARQTPHGGELFPITPPYAPRSSLPTRYGRNPEPTFECPVLHKTYRSPSFTTFFAVHVFLLSFIATKKIKERYKEIAIKWFMVWLTVPTCIHFGPCECDVKEKGAQSVEGVEAR